jgi:hypothetical protein
MTSATPEFQITTRLCNVRGDCVTESRGTGIKNTEREWNLEIYGEFAYFEIDTNRSDANDRYVL